MTIKFNLILKISKIRSFVYLLSVRLLHLRPITNMQQKALRFFLLNLKTNLEMVCVTGISKSGTAKGIFIHFVIEPFSNAPL